MEDSVTYLYQEAVPEIASGIVPVIVPGTNVRAESAAAVFGEASRAVLGTAQAGLPVQYGEVNKTDVHVIDGLSLALFLFYVFILFRFRDSVAFLFKAATGVVPMNAVVTYNNVTFKLFVDTANVMGALAAAALLLSFYISSGGGEEYAAVAVCVAMICTAIYRKIVNKLIARLSTDAGFVQQAAIFDRVVFALAAMLLAPPAMACGYFAENENNIFRVIIAIMLIVLTLYYLTKNLGFFVSGKVSVLQWFLYLCAVEILPVSYFLLLFLRNYNG